MSFLVFFNNQTKLEQPEVAMGSHITRRTDNRWSIKVLITNTTNDGGNHEPDHTAKEGS